LKEGLLERIAARARRQGSLSYEEYVDAALYDPDGGFYSTGGGAGRHHDFLTSPEVGPLFGAVVARALDSVWHDLGDPDPFVVVEAGAGTGALAVSVLHADPACVPALRYVLVERSPALRARHSDHLALEPPAWGLGPAFPSDEDGPRPEPGTGPLVVSLAELPALTVTGVVLANELLDNLPFRLLERSVDGWAEVRVVAADGDRLREALVEASPELAAVADRAAPDARPGSRVPLQRPAALWLGQALALVDRGRLIVFDYMDDTASMAARPWRAWVRTYRAHGPGSDPLDEPGSQDVTCEVAVDQLVRVRHPARDRRQGDFLREHGIDALVEAGRREWDDRAHVADLAALAARSRVREAEALLAPGGLGDFRVLEWEAGERRNRDG
jgi:SAM-dependent MidA family methyltransferase